MGLGLESGLGLGLGLGLGVRVWFRARVRVRVSTGGVSGDDVRPVASGAACFASRSLSRSALASSSTSGDALPPLAWMTFIRSSRVPTDMAARKASARVRVSVSVRVRVMVRVRGRGRLTVGVAGSGTARILVGTQAR